MSTRLERPGMELLARLKAVLAVVDAPLAACRDVDEVRPSVRAALAYAGAEGAHRIQAGALLPAVPIRAGEDRETGNRRVLEVHLQRARHVPDPGEDRDARRDERLEVERVGDRALGRVAFVCPRDPAEHLLTLRVRLVVVAPGVARLRGVARGDH